MGHGAKKRRRVPKVFPTSKHVIFLFEYYSNKKMTCLLIEKTFRRCVFFFVPCPTSVLLLTCVFQGLRDEASVRSPQDRRVLVALERYMTHIENGTLIHGPLLGWATVMGDALVMFRSDANAVQYLMPRRTGVPFQEYPWTQHGALQY